MKKGVLEPQGRVVAGSLENLGYSEVREVRIGKVMDIELDDMPKDRANKLLDEICQKLLANPVIEDYSFEIVKE
jgi:phosphoribosylformylglycinamidine synthase